MRDYDKEYRDTEARKYAYDFDTIVRKYLLRTFAPHFSPNGHSLELGCYKGDMTALILEYFHKLTVVEAAPELASLVGSRFGDRVTVVNATFENASLGSQYDNIFLVHTLEHLDDPVATLTRIKAWLSAGGRLFVAVPNANALSRQIAVKMGLVEHNAAVTTAEAQHGHRRTYSMDVFLHHLKCAGYRTERYGGVLVKALANFQFDRAIAAGIVDNGYLEACNDLAASYPDLSASIYAICASPD